MAGSISSVFPQLLHFVFCSCSYNCRPKVIPSKKMIIDSYCTGPLCKNITQYRWSLFEESPADFRHSWTEVIDLENRTLTDLNNPNLVLTGKLGGNEYSLEMNTSYKINCFITVEGGGKIPSFKAIFFQTVAPLSVPKKRCSVTPKQGYELETNFAVNCSGWHAKSVNLMYDFRYV